MDIDNDGSLDLPEPVVSDTVTMLLSPALVERLFLLHSSFEAAKQRFDNALALVKDTLNIPVKADVHVDLDKGTIAFEVQR